MAASTLVLSSSATVLILSDANFNDPKPHTIAEFLKFKSDEVVVKRVTTISTLQAIGDSGVVSQDNLRYLIVACMSPIIAGAATAEGNRSDNVGNG